ncbi:MAG: type II toxin-antitoxin system PemK/MazF family toxin [Nitrospira sp. SB0666_bin_27]|nr:type II toxin-antitoxin system PemK/MazF family toxin [Nitrospira sp. SB0666_bin_27]MYF25433.1 type II toxin-antitoxin system PemK/MazF family toxin [Nitrospira sp. SB0678_bin_10]MYI89198.1 type II toxin-antitoxin system PemK/MazF family toxin [Gammaproteobacteria bacterium]
MPAYVPKKGDFVILTFDPQAGHEQKGRRPALVVSNTLFNRHTGLAMVCPITKASRKIPFHVAVPEESSLTGYIMVEQLKSVDSARRRVKFIEKAPGFVLDEVLSILDACLYTPQE